MISQAEPNSASFATSADAVAASAEREHRLSKGLAAVIGVTDQLLLCPDEDTLVRRAVELAREQLGVERFAIFLDIAGTGDMIGTYGTDMQGQTTIENALRIPATGDIPLTPPPPGAQTSMRWIYHDKDYLRENKHEEAHIDRDWMVVTPIFSASGRVGVAFQDAAISKSPVDDTLLDIVTIYCSMLGSMIESKRAAEAARQSQRETSEGLGIVLDMADELVLCEDLDSLLRRSVEMVGERLGIERIGIFLKNGDQDLHGTYGIDREGNFRDESALTVPSGVLDMPTPASKNALSRLKIYQQAQSSSDTNSPEEDRRNRDWVVTTPIQSSQGVIGVCFNDNTLTKQAMDESQQEKLAVFCSMLGNMIESKRAWEAMRQSQRSIATLMSNLPGMAYRSLNDSGWTLEFVSEGALELTGYPPEALIQNRQIKFVELCHPDDRAAMDAQIKEALRQRASFQLSYRISTAQGQQKWVSEQGSGVFSPEGEVLGLEGFISDITARTQAEAELRQAKNELEERVRERTAELGQANEQLRLENFERQAAMATLHDFATALGQAKEEAERANNAKSEFLSRMSHELRTPLNAILGFGQVLEMAELPPKRQEAVTHILKAGRHLLGLINEVLDIARVEAGHLELSMEAVPLEGIVAECCSLLRPLAAQRGIQLEENGGGLRGSHVMADPQRLKQVLLNLLGNAIKYNREEGEVVLRCHAVAGGRISLAVSDSGPGISSTDLGKLFSPFERLGAAHTEVEGTGLGLVLSQRLVEVMGGSLHVESTIGQGTTFFLELDQAPDPQKLLDGLKEGHQEMVSPPLLETPLPLRQVLVIEDNLSNLRLMEVILEARPQVSLLAAMQGSVGLDLARQHQPDLILLDLNLPDISGKDVLTRLQDMPLTRDIPVIIISADATSQQIERLLSAGAKQYLTKPLDVKQFLRLLDEFLEQGENEGSRPQPHQSTLEQSALGRFSLA